MSPNEEIVTVISSFIVRLLMSWETAERKQICVAFDFVQEVSFFCRIKVIQFKRLKYRNQPPI